MYTLRAGHKKIIIYHHPGIICIKNRRYLKRAYEYFMRDTAGRSTQLLIFSDGPLPRRHVISITIGIGYRAAREAQIWEIKTKALVKATRVTKLTLLIIAPELHSSTLAKVITLDGEKLQDPQEARHTTSVSLSSHFPSTLFWFSLDPVDNIIVRDFLSFWLQSQHLSDNIDINKNTMWNFKWN